jgi:3-deoxy-7-phosphoheptulonate synthase
MPTPDRNLRAVNLPTDWNPQSWRNRTAMQLPQYPDAAALESALAELRELPPLVTSWEILSLKQ